jgi:hypothetical protein
MANFASLRGPVGLNRVFVEVPKGQLTIDPWLIGIKQGKTFATNGPLLGFSLGDQPLGGELKLGPGAQEVKFTAWMRSIVPIDHLDIICNGKVVRELKTNATRDAADEHGTLPISSSGWCVLRASGDKARFPILDLYPYATTSPIYVTVEGSSLHPKDDANYFVRWIDQLIAAAQANQDWNTDTEKKTVLDQFSQARAAYEKLLQEPPVRLRGKKN